MSAVLEAREPGAKYLDTLQPPPVRHFGLLSTAPGGVARLRELILDLAIRGRLIPRHLNEDCQIADATVDDSGPFELPEGWSWMKLGALQPEFQNGAASRGDAGGQPITVLRLADIKDRRVSLANTRQVPIRRQDIEKYRLRSGDILITRVNGSADIVGQFNLVEGEPQAIYCDHFIRMRVSRDVLDPKYLALFGGSEVIRSRISNLFISTAGQKTVNQGHIGSLPIAIPPLAEQSRIVTRVDELMRLCDALEAKGRLEAEQHARLLDTLLGMLTDSTTPEELAANWQRVAAHFDLLLDRPKAVDALEQTVLQLAVRGLLVPQDPSDEPATALLARIRVEKDQLIASGKIRRDKPLPGVDADSAPFALPYGWTWARFPELGEFGRGKSKHRPRNDPTLFRPPIYPLVQTGEVARAKGTILEYHSKYSELGLAQSRLWPAGTLCITIAANIADAAILGFDACFPDSVVGFVPARCLGGTTYFHAFLETAKTDLIKFAPATAQKNINLEVLESLLVPVPPKREVERIVVRVTELRRLCAELRQRLIASQVAQAHLADTLVNEVA